MAYFFSNIPKLRYQKLSLVTGSSIFREKLNDLFDGDSNKRKYPMKKRFLDTQKFHLIISDIMESFSNMGDYDSYLKIIIHISLPKVR